MKRISVETRWLEDLAFETEVNGHKIILDADPQFGGKERGPRPKPLMLSALGGCTAMDVISILDKMHVKPDGLNVIVEGDLGDEHPVQFEKMHVIYEFKGKDLPLDKLRKAVELSEEKYCGVRAFYKKTIALTSEIRIIK
ncbi:MAG: OsmC family protein [Bacteroidales bacterium]|nr:OsmC family protein [Bacteroidales bacterium]MDD2425206.1 OsmC family protein [Bacteroidales bacterium]MDD2813989.1 OsmC family protein [Bacteroidales bacterium]MDD3988577.1 OsmC family protein [Bacteroidales bacterium]MDD4638151.1 OsmC family protein [Bacteroidales bacterium]